MVNNHIRVYARIKKENSGHKSRYEVLSDANGFDVMKIYQEGTSFKRKRRTFKFNKVFHAQSSQEDIFSVIAKPIIHDVFTGLNATIFAYGATGSGKTYTLTGSQTEYDERGLIPRTIEYLFQLVTNNMSNYMFFISYLEIYNENAYDLLNPKQNFTCLEELPRVVVLEDEKGEAHFKNLSLKEVNTEKEAMLLLYSGDNNRTIAETPLNDYSSRSHCVFTVHVISKCHTSGNITRSKLNLVDLAGSERLHRMNLRGMTLNEARHINLSLHYLERVIQALSQKGNHHVPYRNSMMTFILRDSLGGNCLTAMLATLSMLHLNLDESISTCKFAQRVCLITLEANVNYVPTPENELHYLRSELKRLKRQMNEESVNIVSKLSKLVENKKLSTVEEEECKFAVKQYLLGKDDYLKLNDARKVKYYIEFMKERVDVATKLYQFDSRMKSEPPRRVVPIKDLDNIEKIEKKYQKIIEQKDEEISILMNVYTQQTNPQILFAPMSNESLAHSSKMDTLEKREFKTFFNQSKYKQHYDDCVKHIKIKYHEAVKVAKFLSSKQKQISSLKRALIINDLDTDAKLKLNLDQNFYREQLDKMHHIRGDIEDLKLQMNKLKGRIMDDYKLSCFSGPNLGLDVAILNCKSNCNTNANAQGDYTSSELLTESLPRESCKTCNESSKAKTTSTITQYVDNYHTKCEVNKPITNHELSIDESTKRLCSSTTSLLDRQENGLSLDRSQNCSNIPSEHLSSSCKCCQQNDNKMEVSKPKFVESCVDPCSSKCTVRAEVLGNLTNKRTCESNTFPRLKVFGKGMATKTIPRSRSPRTVKTDRHSKDNGQLSIVHCKSADFIDHKRVDKVEKDKSVTEPQPCYKFVRPGDNAEFVAYLKSIPLTGDEEVDEEIIKFYRLKYKRHEIKALMPNN